MLEAASSLLFLVFMSAPFGVVAFKFTSLKIDRVPFVAAVGGSLVFAAFLGQLAVVFIAVISALCAARVNALQMSSYWRLAFFLVPGAVLLAIPYLAIKGEPSVDKIYLAAAEGDVEALRAEILSGISVDQVDHKGATPLFYAARNGNIEAIKYLLSQGANPVARLPSGSTPEDIASRHGQRRAAEALRQAIHGDARAKII